MKLKYKTFFEQNNLNNIIFLDNAIYEIDKDIYIIGSTFWTQSPFSNDSIFNHSLNDYEYIFWEKRQKVLPSNINHMSKIDSDFITEQLDLLKDKQIIMATHFPPHSEGTSHPKYSGEQDLIKQYFAWPNNTFNTFNKYNNIKCWISGHTHFSYDFIKDNVRLISNQYGYRREMLSGESSFNSDNVYDIDFL